MKCVYVLQHEHEMSDGVEDTKMIGVYSSMEEAEQAAARLRLQPGFCDSPEGFNIDEYEINKDHWAQGFAEERCDL